jgi:glycosyltransferase involved in cell wall biosynthesis
MVGINLSGNILILTQWSFKDALVQTYTLPYVEIIRNIVPPERKIIVVTAEQQPISLTGQEKQSVRDAWQKKNMQWVPQPYKKFGIRKLAAAIDQLFSLYRTIKKEKISVIHAFCTPAGSLGYILSVLTGARLIVDSYEPHAEAMVENGTWKKNGLAYRILFALERKQTRRAVALIATTEGMREYALERYGVAVKIFFVKPACVDLEKFYPGDKDAELLKELNLSGKIVCVYAGKLGGIYFREEVFDFIKICYDHWKEEFRFLMLTNAPKEETEAGIRRVGLPEHIVISRFVFHNEVPRYLSLGDFAINPVKPVPTKRYCTSIKDGEYWAMGLPVIISPDISDDSGIIEKENTGVVMNFKIKQEANEIPERINILLKEGTTIRNKIRSLAEKYRSFSLAEKIYNSVYS